MTEKIKSLVDNSKSVVIIQADNPDADSLASSLALEHILGDLGKDVVLYCGVNIPDYLRYMEGWDRVVHDLPSVFDLSVFVDVSAITLLDTLNNSGQLNWLKSKPSIIIDHHMTSSTIDFASIKYIKQAISTSELIYGLCVDNEWEMSVPASEYIAISILSDSLGLMSEATTSASIRLIAELVDEGVSLPKIDSARKSLQKKSPKILAYKGALIQRVEYSSDGSIAFIHIPWSEIEQYSHEYNPAMLVLDEMRMVSGVKIAIVFKSYPDGKITGKIRANFGFSVADKLAEHFKGGGHPYASGFKITRSKPIDEVVSECVHQATKLLQASEMGK